MKQVTIDTVRERIAELEMVNSHGELSLRGEFELACLRQLAALQERVAELEENDREQMDELYRRNATIHRLQQQASQVVTVAPVVPDEMTPEMMRAVQLNSELGAYAVSNLSGAYDLFSEFWKVARSAAMLNQAHQEPDTDNTAQQFEALATSAQREPVAAVKHYTGNEYPTLKFAQNEWCVCGDRDDAQELADAINALATRAGSGKSEHMLNAERIAREAQALSDRLNATNAVHPRVSGWSERQQKVISYALWRFSCAAYQKANQAAQTNNKDMFDRFIRDARCAEEIREEFTSAWVGKL
ncbi:hypothetical protein G5Z15_003812 [Escherichia coli]|nr:hypothetical protein [Escherichia coli]